MLRHGETVHTVEKRFSGAGGDDPVLNDRGVDQARRAAEVLRGRGVSAIVSSPLKRTRQTAEIAGETLGLSVRVVDDLAECNFGEWDGLTFTDVREQWPDELAAWLGSTSVAPPGGESFDSVERRVLRARDQIIARHPRGTVLVVTHVTPIKTLVRAALSAPADALFRMELATASLSEVHWFNSGAASLRSFSESAHLRD
jgi:probable phosphoglycerate mutase